MGKRDEVNITVLYVGSSLLAPLRQAEADIRSRHRLKLRLSVYDCMLPLTPAEWADADRGLSESDLVFVLHVTDAENSARIAAALDRIHASCRAAIVINCMADLMRRTRLGSLEFARLPGTSTDTHAGYRLVRKLASWMSGYAQARRRTAGVRPPPYLKFATQLPAALRFVPPVGPLRDVKNYLTLFSYFLQPTPANIRSMLLLAVKCYVPGFERINVGALESRPLSGIYHPDAPALFETFEHYRDWYEKRSGQPRLQADRTIAMLLMRPQVVSGACAHYDVLIHAVEEAGLAVVPVVTTLMDNREACGAYLVDPETRQARVAEILSLTGFSFVGGPAMNDSEAAVKYLKRLNRPVRSALCLEGQRVEQWAASRIGLNPVQTAMQVAIPEVDGVTEPLLLGGTPVGGDQPEAVEDRCLRIARRLKRWNRLRTAPRKDLRLAFVIYCFPPNRGNIGTAADLDVFSSLFETLTRLKDEGYVVEAPETADALRERVAGAETGLGGVAGRLSADDYFQFCPYVGEIEREWGPAPGHINTQGSDILVYGARFGNALVVVQPTFGYEGDPMRLLMAEGGTPHHGFMGLYTYLDRVFQADVLVHVGTHGALEFMPGKQVGLSSRCWPDRLIGDFPNLYLYSVNNPSEGAIAKRRSYAVLLSYLTPPVENAGLYKDLSALKEMISAYRLAADAQSREYLFSAIEEKARDLHLSAALPGRA